MSDDPSAVDTTTTQRDGSGKWVVFVIVVLLAGGGWLLYGRSSAKPPVTAEDASTLLTIYGCTDTKITSDKTATASATCGVTVIVNGRDLEVRTYSVTAEGYDALIDIGRDSKCWTREELPRILNQPGGFTEGGALWAENELGTTITCRMP